MSSQLNEYQNVLNSRVNQTQIQTLKQQFKLPSLVPPPSRARLLSKKENKAPPLHLPSINHQDDPNSLFRNTEIININHTQNQSLKDQFASQVQQKLRMILGTAQGKNKQSQSQTEPHHPNEEVDDLEFQQKIHENKQILKMYRNNKNEQNQKRISLNIADLKKLEAIDKITSNNSHPVANKSKPKSINHLSNKPQSNYEKKMKDYNSSLQNKFLQRKKQSLGIIIQKQEKDKPMQRAKSKKVISLKDAIDEVKDNNNFGYKKFKSNGQINNGNDQSGRQNSSKPYIPSNKSIKSHQASINITKANQKLQNNASRKTEESSSKKINKTASLFDNIQTFLQNPTAIQKHQKFYKELSRKLQHKDLNKLQEQIKQINDKMGTNEHNQTKSTVGKQQLPQKQKQRHFLLTQSPLQRTAKDWKRMQVKDKYNINYEQSNFEKQLDYISYLQQKNTNSLSKFIDHQKMMVQLQLNRRLSKSIGKEVKTEH